MPLRDDLLNPIPGDNPSGKDLRYAPVYDKIKEARREDDDAPQGEWVVERKHADWGQVAKLCGDCLATETKDLQLMAWLSEAMVIREHLPGLRACLTATTGLLNSFWDTIYPELEDGDAEYRATPLQWMGDYLDRRVRGIPLTKSGHSYIDFKVSRTVPTEAEAGENADKAEKRGAMIGEGKITPEEFDAGVLKTPVAQLETLVADFDRCMEALETLNGVCIEKFGDVAPSFNKLRTALEEVRHSANLFLRQRKPAEAPPPPAVEEAPLEEEAPEPVAAPVYAAPATAAAPAMARKRAVAGLEPADSDEAVERIAAVASWMRQQDASNPAPYLILRGLRWGELRAGGSSPDGSLLEAPPTEIRQQMKRQAGESDWEGVRETAEQAMALPAGRAWLDVQRYAVRAATELGYSAIADAIKSELRSLLADFPDLPNWSLTDDTPAANAETQAWLKADVLVGPAPTAPESYAPPPMAEEEREALEGATEVPDAYDMAVDLARHGRNKDALEMLSREIAQERSGRGRFQRRMQLAQICLTMGQEKIALAILEELAAEIDNRHLEDWEAAETVAHPLTLLIRCLDKTQQNAELRQRLYDKVCRLDPVQALAVSG